MRKELIDQSYPVGLTPGRLIRLPEVLFRLSISKSSFYAGVKSGKFPPSVPLGERSRAWRSEDILPILQKGV